MRFNTLFFDLDETVYPSSSGVWAAIRDRMQRYMIEQLGIPAEEVPALRERLYREYGTTMRGLQYERGLDTDAFLAYVHDIPLVNYLSPAPSDREALLSLPQQRFIFTNADVHHARRVLNILNLSDCFEGIMDITMFIPHCKPQPEAFEIALKKAGSPDPTRCVLIDDLPVNLKAARQMGFSTILISENPPENHDFDAHIRSLSELPTVLTAL
ncbi:MAG TPA: pyrimidine 5'-nucleotidase [Anaerolineaceae bacterium]|nr:pyrimidine 5'-nucleotidase [Anaerolineaceae bacterium]